MRTHEIWSLFFLGVLVAWAYQPLVAGAGMLIEVELGADADKRCLAACHLVFMVPGNLRTPCMLERGLANCAEFLFHAEGVEQRVLGTRGVRERQGACSTLSPKPARLGSLE